MTTTFHHSSLESPRIQKLLAFLKERGQQGATTMEIAVNCASTRPASDVSELRACGIEVQTDFVGTNANGRKVFKYSLWQPVDDL